ncbi:very short patch repair endonuclease [Ralstonia pseudosolanacearum]|uniref:very short patch repair endonuclease n=1 Tax=Ralstonia pseudosolanacearum TaxID=1310165 RepID=UPI00288034F9|nr:very short patch repair endonuclease [Ralstonia pseudosolanacearum]
MGPAAKRGNAKRRTARQLPLTRSENMSRIRGKDTKPEMIVRRVLWAAGLRYRLHDKRLPGKPDLAFPGRRMAVFVHGCFWHCHEGCKDFRIPKTRTSWWVEKLSRNKTRDTRVAAELKNRGWQVIVIWECEVHDPQKLASLVAQIRQAAETTAP